MHFFVTSSFRLIFKSKAFKQPSSFKHAVIFFLNKYSYPLPLLTDDKGWCLRTGCLRSFAQERNPGAWGLLEGLGEQVLWGLLVLAGLWEGKWGPGRLQVEERRKEVMRKK